MCYGEARRGYRDCTYIQAVCHSRTCSSVLLPRQRLVRHNFRGMALTRLRDGSRCLIMQGIEGNFKSQTIVEVASYLV